MDGQNSSKLKFVLQNVPPGFLVDTRWLNAHAISRQSVSAYVKQGWLERLMQGVYRRPFGPSENSEARSGWKIPLLSAQWIMGYRFHLGGVSALALQGHAHYLPLGEESAVHIYGDDIPAWLSWLAVDGGFVRHGSTLFGDETAGIEDGSFSLANDSDASLRLSPWRWRIRMSTPERAILEALDELPGHESFHNLDVLFEGLVNLRPRLLATLLQQCRSVKVKRLFFVYADRHGHAWRRHIDTAAFDLGSGDRALAPGGRLHPVYRVTVPPDLMPREADNGA